MDEWEKIGRDLAGKEPVAWNQLHGHQCALCGAHAETGTVNHEDRCPWKRAIKLVHAAPPPTR